jgi:hypothetical protein
MLKNIHLSALVSASLILFLPEIAWTRPPQVTPPFPVVPSSDLDTLFCYMKTEDGQLFNLNTLCKKTTQNYQESTNNTFSASACNLVDANGVPCPTENTESPEAEQLSFIE